MLQEVILFNSWILITKIFALPIIEIFISQEIMKYVVNVSADLILTFHHSCDKMPYIKSYIRFFIGVKKWYLKTLCMLMDESLKSKPIKRVIGGCVFHKWQLCSPPIMSLPKQIEIIKPIFLWLIFFINDMKRSHTLITLLQCFLRFDICRELQNVLPV